MKMILTLVAKKFVSRLATLKAFDIDNLYQLH